MYLPTIYVIETIDPCEKSDIGCSNSQIGEQHYYSNYQTYPFANENPISNDEIETSLSTQVIGSMIRKKSGDVVKSSLKQGSCRQRSNSLPSDCMRSKVHFDDQLEQIQFFFASERPAAISHESSSKNECQFTDSFPFTSFNTEHQMATSAVFDLSNSFVQLEFARFSSESSLIVGKILVKNITYQKDVVLRFTFDNWQTISEIRAFYDFQQNDETSSKIEGFDRFTFNIKVNEFINLNSEPRCITFCVRYNVINEEFWDNNFGKNYQLNLHDRHFEAQHLRRTKSCPPIQNTNSFPQSQQYFFDL